MEELELLRAVQRLALARRAAAASATPANPLDGDAAMSEVQPVFSVRNLNFKYPNQAEAVLVNANFAVYPRQRILLVGVNGAGKSTLLRTVCGYHIAEWEKFEVAGLDSGTSVPWSDQFRGLAYLGGQWKQQSGFTGPEPYSRDIRAGDMVSQTPYPALPAGARLCATCPLIACVPRMLRADSPSSPALPPNR